MSNYEGKYEGEGRSNIKIRDSYKEKLIKIKGQKIKDEPSLTHSNASTIQWCIDYVFNKLGFSIGNEDKNDAE